MFLENPVVVGAIRELCIRKKEKLNMIDIENPPEIVADIFASLIKNYNFETVEFAVFCRNDTKNYDVFESRFVKS